MRSRFQAVISFGFMRVLREMLSGKRGHVPDKNAQKKGHARVDNSVHKNKTSGIRFIKVMLLNEPKIKRIYDSNAITKEKFKAF